ncbi:hypothetical protein VIBNISOn1_1840035 [Vibrio nigripulchritudo SOn1]|uniref:Uncharacterized protein n=1 Tax=Vibrio nigripulchritudo SOn1 TaxID=1238450 RepID=A0AAV2VPQ9_9VIBR|nr:hypothetical protein VIBNISOn1_1840035 [Vibrio nigripulchritudo SOn1]
MAGGSPPSFLWDERTEPRVTTLTQWGIYTFLLIVVLIMCIGSEFALTLGSYLL